MCDEDQLTTATYYGICAASNGEGVACKNEMHAKARFIFFVFPHVLTSNFEGLFFAVLIGSLRD